MPDLVPRSIRLRGRLIVLALALYLLVPISLSALQLKKSRPAREPSQNPASSPSPTPEPSPPTVDFQAVPDRDNAGPDDEIQIALFIANKSSKPISKLRLDFNDPAFTLTKQSSLPDTLPAFRSFNDSVTIKPGAKTFGARKLLLSLEYTWKGSDAGPEFVSRQPVTASLSVTRRFEEEAKGFPGGTVAFLYLLLPIIPAILSYQFFDGRRKGEDWKVPSFGTEFVVPAFLFAVVINLGMLLLFSYNTSLGYSNPLTFILLVAISAIAGAIVPLYRWKREVDFRKREAEFKELWSFTDGETAATYLRKALLKPGASRKFKLSEVTVGAAQWKGLRLQQPDGSAVLGAILQVYPNQATPEQLDYLTSQVVSEKGVVLDAEQLIRMVEAKDLGWRHEVSIVHDRQKRDELVVIDEVKNGQWADGDASPLVIPSR
jgi:hypothetical protein